MVCLLIEKEDAIFEAKFNEKQNRIVCSATCISDYLVLSGISCHLDRCVRAGCKKFLQLVTQ